MTSVDSRLRTLRQVGAYLVIMPLGAAQRSTISTSAPASLEPRHEEVGLPRRHQGLYEYPGGGDAGGGALQPARQDGRRQEAGALRDALLPKGAAWRLRDGRRQVAGEGR